MVVFLRAGVVGEVITKHLPSHRLSFLLIIFAAATDHHHTYLHPGLIENSNQTFSAVQPAQR